MYNPTGNETVGRSEIYDFVGGQQGWTLSTYPGSDATVSYESTESLLRSYISSAGEAGSTTDPQSLFKWEGTLEQLGIATGDDGTLLDVVAIRFEIRYNAHACLEDTSFYFIDADTDTVEFSFSVYSVGANYKAYPGSDTYYEFSTPWPSNKNVRLELRTYQYIDSSGGDSSYDFEECEITALAQGPVYTFQSTSSNGGKIHPSEEIEVQYGADQIYILPPDPTVSIVDFIVDGVSQGAISEYTFYSVSGEHTVHAEFELNHEIAVDYSGEGSIYPPGNGYISGEESYSFYFVPTYGYEISDVLVNGVPQGSLQEYTFEGITSHQTLFVNFAPWPVLKEYPPIAVGDTFAEIQGEVVTLSGNSSLDISFEWGLSGEYTNSTAVQTVSNSGELINAPLSELISGEIYNYRIYATNGSGEWRSDSVFFKALRADFIDSISTLSELNQGDTGDLIQLQDSLILPEQEVLSWGIKEKIQGGTCFDLGQKVHTGTIELGYTNTAVDFIPLFDGDGIQASIYSNIVWDTEDEYGKLEFSLLSDVYRSSPLQEYTLDGGKHWLAIRWCKLEGAADNFVEMLIDGKSVYLHSTPQTDPSGEFTSWSTDLLLGSDIEGTDISNVRIWTDIRTPQEIQDNAWIKLREEENTDLFFSFWLDEGEGNYASSTSGRFVAYVDTPEESWITGIYETEKEFHYVSPVMPISGEIQCLDSLQQSMNQHRESIDTFFVVGKSSNCFYPLTPDMTSNFDPYGFVERVDDDRQNAHPAFYLFDGNKTDAYDPDFLRNDGLTATFDFFSRVVACRCDVCVGYAVEAPKGITISASNDSENWEVLFSDSFFFSDVGDFEERAAYFQNTTAYRFYRTHVFNEDFDSTDSPLANIQFFRARYVDQIAQGESLKDSYLFIIKKLSTSNTWITPKLKWLFAGMKNSDVHDHVFSPSRINAQLRVGRVMADWKKAYLITATAGENGQIDPSGEFTGMESQEIGFAFTPNTDYVVENVTVDGSDKGNIDFYNLIVSSSHSIAASFKKPSIRVLTKDAEDVSETGAVLNGFVEHLGSFSSGEVFFEWSYDRSLSNQTSGEIITTSGEFSGELTELVPPAKISFCASMLVELPDEGASFIYRGGVHYLTLTTDWEMTIVTKEEFDAGTFTNTKCTPFGNLILEDVTVLEHFDHGYTINSDSDDWALPFDGSWEQIRNIDKTS